MGRECRSGDAVGIPSALFMECPEEHEIRRDEKSDDHAMVNKKRGESHTVA
jgi:hypothetical protein